ncbi:MAG: AMP-binding protein, partial [Alphaproteobacteria bacterium]|nr:AMP-binding protein [Alphaproteobacteria bacterium]
MIPTASSHHTIEDGLSLPACFARIVAAHGARPAIAAGDWRPSYAELDATANRIAGALIERGAVAGDRVAILMDHDGAQIAAALAVLKAGCIGVALNPSQPPASIGATIEHAQPTLVIADRARRALAAAAGSAIVDYEAALAAGSARDPDLAIPAEQTAFLVYTSGSTGRPKAIMRTHALLRQNAARHGRGVGIAADDRLTLLASLSGGQGIGVMWTALLAGAALCPYPIAERGFAALADRLDADRATTFISSASVFRGFARTLPSDRRFPLIRAVRIASETATAEDFEAFRRHFPASARFVHSYGCSEVGNVAQHVVSPGERVEAGRLPVGLPADDLAVAVVDEGGRPLPAGEVGTIVVTGRHLAAGYWREPALTAERFAPAPGVPGLRSFRSGDLGRFDAAGRLAIVGRSDSQVKIRGQRVELAAVEAAILEVPGIEQAAACAVPRADGDARLVAYIVAPTDSTATIARLRRCLRAALPRAMVPTAFVAVDVLPLTPHGKIDRAALVARHPLPAPPSAGGTPQGAIERRVAAIWAEVFESSAVGRDDDFFALGGDSLTAAIVAMQVHDALAVDIELAAFAAHPTVARFAAEVARRIDRREAIVEPPLRRIAREGALPLSCTQRRLWAYSQSPAAFAGYRHVRRHRLMGPLDREALRAAIDAVIARHEILRTCYPDVDGMPRAAIADAVPADLPFLDAAGAERPLDRAEAFAAEAAAEITDLARLPLLRFALVRIAADDHIFYRISHHILGDGESWRIFFDELEAAYS